MKKTEVIEIFKTNFDKKNKLNRLNKSINSDILDKIEHGLTLESLEVITKDLPVFKYYSQITIHGLFPEVTNNYCFGYKNIFQNKNKSIGVRWSAIDEIKRKKMNAFLKHSDYFYHRNSTEHCFRITKRVNEQNYTSILADLKTKLEKIDTSLFFGHKQIYAAVGMWGDKYLVLQFSIDAIYDKNISVLLNKMGYTKQWLTEKINEQNSAEVARKKEYELSEIAEDKKQKETWGKSQKDIDFLNENYKKVTSIDAGIYLKLELNYPYEQVKFRVVRLIKFGKKAKRSFLIFDNLKDALTVKESDFSNNKVSNYPVKDFYLLNTGEPQKPVKTVATDVKSVGDIVIVNYSKKAIAIFGDTKPIKDKLRSAGCRFNAYLTYQNKKQAGWVAQTSKRAEIEAILN